MRSPRIKDLTLYQRITVVAYLGLAAGVIWLGSTGAAAQQPRVDYNARPTSAIHYLKVANAGEDDRLGRAIQSSASRWR
jgi:hypothetical protein